MMKKMLVAASAVTAAVAGCILQKGAKKRYKTEMKALQEDVDMLRRFVLTSTDMIADILEDILEDMNPDDYIFEEDNKYE